MKSVFLNQQLEYRLEVAGDEFSQGDVLPCSLLVKNRGSAECAGFRLFLTLAHGEIKKVREKKEDAFKVLAEADFPDIPSLAPQAEHRLTWTFEPGRNVAVTDKSQSIFLLFGKSGDSAARGWLQVTVGMHRYFRAFVTVLESTFQFVAKDPKWSKNRLTIPFKPSSAARFSALEELVVCCAFDGDALEVSFIFKVKKLAAGPVSVNVAKAKKELARRLEPSAYLMGGEHLNYDAFDQCVREALDTVVPAT